MSRPLARIYLADDEPALRVRLSALLLSAGYQVVGEGASPLVCVAGILATRPDVVVLDVQLEGGTGLQVLQAVRATAPEIAFVVFSNCPAPGYSRRYLAQGARAFLDKSRDFDELLRAIAVAAGHPPACL